MKTLKTGLILMLIWVLAASTAHISMAEDLNEPHYTLRGTVKDARNNPISFASIHVPGTRIGTVANLDGFFTLHIKKAEKAQAFVISHLGYKTKEFSLADYIGKTSDFSLEPHSVPLQEVVVWPDDARKLVSEALEQVKTNYPQEAQILNAFYRETISQRRNYVSISEALVEVYHAPYTRRSFNQDRTRIIRGRKSGDVSRADTLLLKLQGGPSVAMLIDVVKNQEIFISHETLDFYNYEIIDIVKIEDKNNYVVRFTPRLILPFPLFEGNLYISIDNKAITMAEFSLDLTDPDKAAKNFIQKRPPRLRFTPMNTRYLFTYKEIDGLYQINYIRSELEFFADYRRRLFRTRYNVMFEMAITDRSTENVSRFTSRESFSPRSILADMVPVYFQDNYWGAYNYIEPSESIESAIRKLNEVLEKNE